jgi:hypothetical protein
MGQIKPFDKVKFFVGCIYAKEEVFIKACADLACKYGKIDYISQALKFDFTSYYEKEMGKFLFKKFISFEKLWDPQNIYQVKIQTNLIEEKYAKNQKRRINLDPGIITLGNVILLTTKNFAQRIPLQEGIYAEVHLIYMKRKYHDLSWTYPDYKRVEYKEVFREMRHRMSSAN